MTMIVIITLVDNDHRDDKCLIRRCWTQGKPQKLEYLRHARMWYLTESCSTLNTLTHGGIVSTATSRMTEAGASVSAKWDKLSRACCMAMPGAP